LINIPGEFGQGYRIYWQSEQQQFLAQSVSNAGADVFIGLGAIPPGNSIGSVARRNDAIIYAVDGVEFYRINNVDPQIPLFLSARLQGAGAELKNIHFGTDAQANSNCAFVAQAPIRSRYIRVQVITAGPAPFKVGRIIVGKSFRPLYNKELGPQRTPLDTGTRTRLSDGGLSTVSGRLIRGFKWVFGDLSEAEAEAVWDIVARRRTTEPVIVIEDSDRLSNSSFHYCTLTDLQPYTRLDPRKTRWELTAEDWL
jgi:hypothetical protein